MDLFEINATVFSMMYGRICAYLCACNRCVPNHISNRVLLTALHNTKKEHFKIIISSKRYCHMKQNKSPCFPAQIGMHAWMDHNSQYKIFVCKYNININKLMLYCYLYLCTRSSLMYVIEKNEVVTLFLTNFRFLFIWAYSCVINSQCLIRFYRFMVTKYLSLIAWLAECVSILSGNYIERRGRREQVIQ